MITLTQLQEELKVWQEHNFPGRKWNKPYMGMVEELGEISHALLKQEQGIRGSNFKHEEAIKDGCADLLIFMADFCNARGFSLQEVLDEVWPMVRERDWIKYPNTGFPLTEQPQP